MTIFGEANDGVEMAAVDEWYRNEHLPEALAGSPAAMCLACGPLGLGRGGPKDVPVLEGSERAFLHLYFLDEDANSSWHLFKDHGAVFEATGLGRITFASPFRATVPGTDTYTDQLW